VVHPYADCCAVFVAYFYQGEDPLVDPIKFGGILASGEVGGNE